MKKQAQGWLDSAADDLIMLYNRVIQFLPIDIDMDLLKQISELYIDARYPSDIGLLPNGKPPIETAQAMYLLAKVIHETVSQSGA